MVSQNGNSEAPIKVVLYARVSSEEQKDRQTIDAQVDYFRKYCDLNGYLIAGEYLDDGISGAMSLGQRQAGLQLLEDAKAHKFNQVLFYRFDRLARRLRLLLDAYETLDKDGVVLRSMTEPLDTGSPIGRFMMQLLGSMAELERETITERMSLGRERVARKGKWASGALPYGYIIDEEGKLIPYTTRRDGHTMSEAEAARLIFDSVGNNKKSSIEVANLLNGMGLPTGRKYQKAGDPRGPHVNEAAMWRPNKVQRIIANPVYKGDYIWRKNGRNPVTSSAPPLVEADLWERAGAQLHANRRLSKRNGRFQYLLRGLITCRRCGHTYVGTPQKDGRSGKVTRYYRCISGLKRVNPGGKSCGGRSIQADWLEGIVWDDITQFINNPGDVLESLKAKLAQMREETQPANDRTSHLETDLANKEIQRDRMLDLYRRGRISLDDLERFLDGTEKERQALQQDLDEYERRETTLREYEGRAVNTAQLLDTLRSTMEVPPSWDLRRQLVETLVANIGVNTQGDGRGKTAEVEITYHFSDATVNPIIRKTR